MKRYAKLIWEHVARYTLLDLLTSVFLTGILYFVTKLVCAVTKVGDPYCDYAMQSIKLLGLIYVASILVTSCWGHIRLLGKLVESEATKATPPQGKETDSASRETGASETKC
jgi:hypothetical protein